MNVARAGGHQALMRVWCATLVGLGLVACDGGGGSATDAAVALDASTPDASAIDATDPDAATIDAAVIDAALIDAAVPLDAMPSHAAVVSLIYHRRSALLTAAAARGLGAIDGRALEHAARLRRRPLRGGRDLEDPHARECNQVARARVHLDVWLV